MGAMSQASIKAFTPAFVQQFDSTSRQGLPQFSQRRVANFPGRVHELRRQLVAGRSPVALPSCARSTHCANTSGLHHGAALQGLRQPMASDHSGSVGIDVRPSTSTQLYPPYYPGVILQGDVQEGSYSFWNFNVCHEEARLRVSASAELKLQLLYPYGEAIFLQQ